MSSSLFLSMSFLLNAPPLSPHSLRAGCAVKGMELEVGHRHSTSKGERFIALSSRSGFRILSATTRSRASEQGGGQMTLGADNLQKARGMQDRSLIRGMLRTGEQSSGQGATPPW